MGTYLKILFGECNECGEEIITTASEVQVMVDGKVVGTLSVGNGLVDYCDEINNHNYNLLTVSDGGSVLNDIPTLED